MGSARRPPSAQRGGQRRPGPQTLTDDSTDPIRSLPFKGAHLNGSANRRGFHLKEAIYRNSRLAKAGNYFSQYQSDPSSLPSTLKWGVGVNSGLFRSCPVFCDTDLRSFSFCCRGAGFNATRPAAIYITFHHPDNGWPGLGRTVQVLVTVAPRPAPEEPFDPRVTVRR